MFQANILLVRLAADASDMRIWPGIWLKATKLVQIAEEVERLDSIATAGYTLALGLGCRDQEFQAFGETARTRAAQHHGGNRSYPQAMEPGAHYSPRALLQIG